MIGRPPLAPGEPGSPYLLVTVSSLQQLGPAGTPRLGTGQGRPDTVAPEPAPRVGHAD
jgi:hypothetical protein